MFFDLLLIIFGILVLSFGYVLIFGAPFLPTLKKDSHKIFELLNLKREDVFYDLGCGTGQLLVEAARRDLHAVGYELNPLLYFICKVRTYSNKDKISVKFGNFWNADLSKANGVYAFLFTKFMERLDKKLTKELNNGSRLVSYTFKIPNKKINKSQNGFYLYRY